MGQAGGTVLLVEDYPGLSSVVVKMLSREGYRVRVAGSAEHALTMFGENERPDILMTDISLPGMTGVQLVEVVRKTIPELRVLLVSGSQEHEASIQGLGGSTLFLSKPYRAKELLATLELLMDMPPGSRESSRGEGPSHQAG